MALVQKIDGVTITNRVLLNGGPHGGVTGWPSSAWYGEPMTAGLQLDDPLGNLVIVPWTTYTADETSDTTHPRIFTGWITACRVSRGPYRDGPGRVWDIDIVDQNAIFSFEVLRSSAASVRPAETDVARITALMASHAMAATPIFDNGRFNTSNPLNFGAANFVTQYPQAVLESIGSSGKNFYAYWDDTADEISLHYDVTTANPASTLAISNDIADEDATTFYPFVDAELTLDPARQYSGVLLGYLGGYVYARDEDLFGPNDFSPVNFLRDDVYTTDRIGLLTTANAQVQAQLANRAEPAENVVVTIRVPAAVVNEAHAGMAISLKATHLPGYEAGVAMAIIRRNVVPTPGRRDFYDVTLELSNNTTTVLPPGGGDPGEIPQVDPCDVANVDLIQGVYTDPTEGTPGVYASAWGTDPVPGHMLIASWLADINATPTSVTMAGWDFQGEAQVTATGGVAKYVAMFTKVAESSEGNPTVTFTGSSFLGADFHCQLQEWSGVDTVDAVALEEDENAAQGSILLTITPTETWPFVLNVGSYAISGAVSDLGTIPASGPVIEDEQNFGASRTFNIVSYILEETPGPYSWGTDRTTGTKGAAVGVALICSGSGAEAPCIGPGQPNARPEVVTMTGATGTTRCPFADGSFRVFVDNVEQTDTLVSSDGETGDFELGFDPTPTEVVTVEYLGRVGS